MPISSVNSATFVIEFRAQLLFFSSQRPQGEELVVDLVGAEGGDDEDLLIHLKSSSAVTTDLTISE